MSYLMDEYKPVSCDNKRVRTSAPDYELPLE